MSQNNNGPVHVTGQERSRPAIRKLARVCIELARLRLSSHEDADQQAVETDPAASPDANTTTDEEAPHV